MRLPFNEAKLTQAAAYLLRLNRGKMNYMSLIKLLYLVDRTALLNWGRPVTTDCYVSMDRGPVLSKTLDLINEKREPGTDRFWSRYISAPRNYSVMLLKNPGTSELSSAEEKLIREILAQHRDKDPWELVRFVHQLPEWKNPDGGAIPISYTDILRAGKKTDHQVLEIKEEIDSIAALHEMTCFH